MPTTCTVHVFLDWQENKLPSSTVHFSACHKPSQDLPALSIDKTFSAIISEVYRRCDQPVCTVIMLLWKPTCMSCFSCSVGMLSLFALPLNGTSPCPYTRLGEGISSMLHVCTKFAAFSKSDSFYYATQIEHETPSKEFKCFVIAIP